MTNNIAIIPVRTGSKRIKNKNFLDFQGFPLFYYTYLSAKKSKLFKKIIISTESEKILKIMAKLKIEQSYVRPKKLAKDSSSLDDVCMHALNFYEKKLKVRFDNICLLWATSPLRDYNDINSSFRLLHQNKLIDCVVGCGKYNYSPLCALTTNKKNIIKQISPKLFWLSSQNQPITFADCGSFSWFRRSAFKKEKSWLPKKSSYYLLDHYKTVDLDDMNDLELLKFYFKKYFNKKNFF